MPARCLLGVMRYFAPQGTAVGSSLRLFRWRSFAIVLRFLRNGGLINSVKCAIILKKNNTKEGIRVYYAHRTEDERRETAAEHLQLTARLCQEFAAAFGAGAWGELLGLGHDVGKYSRAFQDHLLKGAPRVDHSTAGAKEVCAVAGLLAAYCVAGHLSLIHI